MSFLGPTTPPRFVTLVLLAAIAILSLNMFLPSLANIAAEFQVGYGQVSLAVSGYLAICAVVYLVVGPLSDRFGRRPLMLGALLVFTLASLGCMLATDIRVFLLCRVFQGAIACGWALSMAMIRDTHEEREAASLAGYVGMAMAVGPMIGPMIGGTLDSLFGWRANFLLYSVAGLAILALCWVDMGETNKNPSSTFARQFRAYPALLGSGRFWGFTLCIMFSISTFHTFLAGAALVAGEVLGLSTTLVGICMGTTTAGFMVGSFIAGRHAKRHALTTMMILGRLVACAGLATGFGFFLSGNGSVMFLFVAAVSTGLGNGISMPSANAGALSVRPDLAGSAAGLSGALTVGSGAAFTWITGSILTVETGAQQLLGLMLLTALLGLAAALAVWWADRRGPGQPAEAPSAG